MHALMIIGGIAFFGWFFLRDRGNADNPPPQLPVTPALGELSKAAAGLGIAYKNGKCAGLTVPVVQRFQAACNAYAASLGKPATLTEDGLFDAATNGALFSLLGVALPTCVGTFQPSAPAYAAQSPNKQNATQNPQPPGPAPAGVPVAAVPGSLDRGRTSSRFKYT